MQLTNTPAKLVLPFANAGAKKTIPTASQIGITAGAASLVDGFPPLTRTPIAAGGVPPSGLDMNGILYALSAALRWANAGGGYVYDGTFAADTNVGGYPKGARVLRSDGAGYWLNTVENNTVDPENTTTGGSSAAAAGWVPDLTNGVAAITMTDANVTLTPLQYGRPIIVITGALRANLNLIFPPIAGEWVVKNNTTGAFAITCKTAAGTGVTAGATQILFGDGTNIYTAVNPAVNPTGFASLGSTQTFTKAQRGAVVALTDAATITPDFALSNNYSLTIGGNRTLAAPTNLVAGQSGVISIKQDATGTRTLAFDAAWKFTGGTVPSLTTTANAVDELVYYVRPNGTTIFSALNKDVK